MERPDQGRLVARRLVDYTLCLYAHRSYLEENGTPKSPEDLNRHRLIGYVEDLVINPSLAYAPEISRDWKPAFEVSSSLGQVEAVRAGAGIGILHSFIACADPDLVPVLPDRADPPRLLACLSRIRAHIAPCHSRFGAHFGTGGKRKIAVQLSMIPKSGSRFSDQIMLGCSDELTM
ncbi:LysR substrate-binding domain-containing protein [Brucella abortus]|nr:LysR substrate-binding domain-containing protein [Brucella abortus]